MAKSRIINTRFWDDPYIVDLNHLEKLVFLYSLSNPLTEISGVYEIPMRRIVYDTGIDKEMLLKIFDRFAKDKKIYYIDGWIYLKNFSKHQHQNPSVIRGAERALSLVPDHIIKKIQGIDSTIKKKEVYKREHVGNAIKRKIFARDKNKCVECGATEDDENVTLEVDHIIPVHKGGDNKENNLQILCRPCNQRKSGQSVTDSHSLSQTGTPNLTKLNLTKLNLTGFFEEWWDEYPKTKRNLRKDQAEAKITKGCDDKEMQIRVQKLKDQKEKDRKWIEGYVPNMSTYLNQERWNLEIEEVRAKPGVYKNPDDNDMLARLNKKVIKSPQ